MATPTTSIMSSISTLWEAVTPPDNNDVAYRENTGRRLMTGTAGHRVFRWLLPRRLNVIAESGNLSHVEYVLEAELRLSTNGRDRDAIADMVATEGNLLMRAVEKETSWPSGTIAVITEAVEPEYDGDEAGSDVVLLFTFAAQVQESD